MFQPLHPYATPNSVSQEKLEFPPWNDYIVGVESLAHIVTLSVEQLFVWTPLEIQMLNILGKIQTRVRMK